MQLMSDRLVVFEKSGPVAYLRLNRPSKMNALNHQMYEELNKALDYVESDSSFRVVVLTGTGRAFCVGSDLNLEELANGNNTIDVHRLLSYSRKASETISRLPALRKPVIAAVNGIALAGGLEIIVSCDLVVAAESARIGEAHSNYGLLSGGGGTARLVRAVGPIVAKYLTLTGNQLSAKSLLSLGLVNEVVADDELEPRVSELANHLAAKSAGGLAHMKHSIDYSLDQSLASALQMDHQALAIHAKGTDMPEGLAAFREKRQPRFSDV